MHLVTQGKIFLFLREFSDLKETEFVRYLMHDLSFLPRLLNFLFND